MSELSGKSQATLTNADIMPVQQDVGGTWTWFKTTISALALFIKDYIIALANTWTAKQTMGAGLDMDNNTIENVASGTATGEALEFSQIDITAKRVYYNNGSTIAEASGLTYDSASNKELSVQGANRKDTIIAEDGFINIAITYTPAGAGDSNGSAGSITWDDDYLYLKNSTVWRRIALTNIP